MRKNRIFFFIFLLFLLQLEDVRSNGDGVERLRGGFGASFDPSQSMARAGRERDGGGEMFDEEKRIIYAGPNPLHN
ncbi:hypothetical protein KFK09_000814 [Dendrobium nobile]|uniref:Uncharacterized protein n=1 Tax=Dendrobium nobile TaxID=94219 RepID=A0A8T3CA03_DENNO|nr:hypothetical protein KFK09_000814 [Dendrobium nobile]